MRKTAAVVLGISGAAVGLLVAVLAGAVFLDEGSAAPSDPRPWFVVLTASAVPDVLHDVDVASHLNLLRVDSPDNARRLLESGTVAGVILDSSTLSSTPADLLHSWYASGEVIVTFNVEHVDVLRAVESSKAFPDLNDDQRPESTLNPGSATGSYAEPYFSVIYRSRPSGGGAMGGETTQRYSGSLFGQIVAMRALNAQGLVDVDGTVRPGSE